ncbi:MAG: HAMP domain-containing sensor histidine kinase [Myxococcota bacterium]|nr:HAMP domain-containing sensor histidine kinase [Myxococcota bacterium]
MDALMAQQRSVLQRLLRRMLASGRGEVRAMEDALHVEGVLRFIAVFAATIVLPASLLAYFGVASIAVEEKSVWAEVERGGQSAADGFVAQVTRRFSSFEQRLADRLGSGRSPLEARGELDPQLLLALRFDQDGWLEAPFVRDETPPGAGQAPLFDPSWQAARAAERAGEPPGLVAGRYAAAVRKATNPSIEGRARYDQARMLAKAGELRLAIAQLDKVIERTPRVRDPWGMRLGDLARLDRGVLVAADDDDAGARELRALIEDLLSTRWVIGQGGEAAVARRALSLLEPYGEREWVAVTRGRVAERAAMLYWAERLMPELMRVAAGTAPLSEGVARVEWTVGKRALWATTWFGGERYVFALDLSSIASELKADARGAVRAEGDVVAFLAMPSEPGPTDPMVQRSLAPWLSNWSLVVEPRDPGSLAAAQSRKRNQRFGVVFLAVVLIAVGSVFSARLIKRELDVARMQTDFAANVSHELRSPITQIRIKGEALMLGLIEEPEERDESYQAIVRESERLSRLVDNVLDFSAIERGAKRYTLRPGDIAETVYRAIDSISSAQEVLGKELDVELPPGLPPVFHDSDAVQQCVINLVSNAAKYSKPGGWIGIRGRVVDEGVEIGVSDRGIGIAPHDLRAIFDPFFRSRDALARRRKGTGIGLTIVQYIMVQHGGRVGVQSRPGHGSTFTLRFPLRPPDEAQTGGPRDTLSSPRFGA